MLLEDLLPFGVLLVGAVTIVVFALRRGRATRSETWTPTFANLHLVCVECEHELVDHPDGRGACRGSTRSPAGGSPHPSCRCRLSRRRAFRTALTPFELAARKEMLPE